MKIASREPSDSKFLISTWLPFFISTATCFTLFLRRNGDMLVVLGDETSGTWVEQQHVLALQILGMDIQENTITGAL